MKLKKEREYTSLGEFEIYDVQDFDTLNTTEEDLWLQLESLTNKDQANDFLYHTLGHKKEVKKIISPILIEFIRQGRSFYTQAEKADSNTSPLLFYYGMLNLVKAYLLSRDPYTIISNDRKKISKENLSHGISAGDKIKNDFSIYSENIELKNNGILSHFYKLLTENKINSLNKTQKEIPIINLLSYCVDISSEYKKVFRKKTNVIGLEVEIAKIKNKAWIRLLFNKEELKQNSLNHKNILLRNPGLGQYQRVLSPYPSRCVLEEKTTFYFSNKKNLQSQVRKRVKQLRIIFSIDSKGKLDYDLPLIDLHDKNILLPEIINIYMTMYYLGSIVRYQPYVLKKILPLKEGWVIQSFVRTCSKKFLRLIVTLMFNKYFVFNEI